MQSIENKKVPLFLLAALAVVLFSSFFLVKAYDVPSGDKIDASDGAADDEFGRFIDIDGDLAIVGARLDDHSSTDAGGAYIFERSGSDWNEVTKLTASDAAFEDEFGSDVGISGDYAVVGARGDGSLHGAAYVFEKDFGGADNWGERKKLTAGEGSGSDDRFGADVAIDGTTIIVGAPNNTNSFFVDGAAYIYDKDQGGADNWGEVTEINHSNPVAGDQFGSEVAISGDIVAVGACTDSCQGSVYIFERDLGGSDNWGERTEVTASDGASGDVFGVANISMNATHMLVGASSNDDTFSGSGSAYVFEKDLGGANNWGERKKLVASDPGLNDAFGVEVALAGSYAIIGSFNDDDGTDSGAAYIFSEDHGGTDNWGQYVKLNAADAAASDFFSIGLEADGDWIALGAYGDDDNGSAAGAAYVFDITTLPTQPDAPSAFTATNFTGTTATLEWTDNASNETGFNIYYATTSTQPGSAAYTPAANATSQAVTGLSTTLPNYFWIAAENQEIESDIVEICLRYSAISGEILPCVGAASNEFGDSVSIDGTTAVIGSPHDTGIASNTGVAYIFENNAGTWTEIAKLQSSDGADADQFGQSVSISGDTIVVGANGDDDNGSASGSAYVFVEPASGWSGTLTEDAKLTASDGAAIDNLGSSSSISGDNIVVGAFGEGTNGAAYVFEEPGGGWTGNLTEDAKLTASSGTGDEVGQQVSISGDTVAVSADQADGAAATSGVVYVFVEPGGGWTGTLTEDATLELANGETSDVFGASVAVDGDTVVVGASFAGPLSGGAAYVFEEPGGGWSGTVNETGELISTDGAQTRYGESVAISGDNVVVGVRLETDNGVAQIGAAYAFVKPTSGWRDTYDTAKFTASDGALDDYLGNVVAISGNVAIAGAPRDDDDGTSSGAAFYFDLTDLPGAPGDPYATNFTGTTATLNWTDNATNEDNFRVYRGTSELAPAGATYTPSANATSQAMTGLSTTLPNYIWVAAENGNLRSAHQRVCLEYSSVAGKFLPCDGMADEYFGTGISIDGNFAVVGSPGLEGGGATEIGKAYVFRRSGTTWTQVATLEPSDGLVADRFGYSTGISGDTVVIGAPNRCFTGTTGYAYIFEEPSTGWAGTLSENAKLLASDGINDDCFGISVDISGDTAVVGASQDNDSGTDSGTAFVFDEPGGGWVGTLNEDAKLSASDAAANQFFGIDVAIDADTVVVGAYGSGISAGGAYIFEEPGGGWVNTSAEDAKLTQSSVGTGDAFGQTVDIDGTTIAVGAPLYDLTQTNRGAVYMFEEPGGGWVNATEDAILLDSTAAGSDLVGRGLALAGGNVFAGGLKASIGKVYWFEEPGGGWSGTVNETAELSAADQAASDDFGLSLSIDGTDLVVAARFDDDNGSDSGSAYYLDLNTFTTPSIPSNFTASAFTGTAATLEWTDNSFDETGFNIYQATTGVQPGTPTYTAGANITTQAAVGLSTTLPNYFWLTADGAYGESDPQDLCLKYAGGVEGKILACDALDSGDNVAYSVAMEEEYAIVGNNTGSVGGEAYIFQANGTTWAQVARLEGSDTAAGDNFGWSVDMSGDKVVVGAIDHDGSGTDVGAVYIFGRNEGGLDNWGEITKLSPSDPTTSDHFGNDVQISDDFVIVGAPRNDTNGTDSGGAYFFEKDNGGVDNWGQAARFSKPTPAASDNFGQEVAIFSNYALVYSETASVARIDAYFRNLGTWEHGSEVTLSDSSVFNPSSVDIAMTPAHSAIQMTEQDSTEAAIYIHERDTDTTWDEVQRHDTYVVGVSGVGRTHIDIEDNTIALAYDEDIVIFQKDEGGTDNWGEFGTLSSADGEKLRTVALDGDYVIAGTNTFQNGIDDGGGTYFPGAAYVLDWSGLGSGASGTKVFDAAGSLSDTFGYTSNISGEWSIMANTALFGGLSDFFIYKKNSGTGDWEFQQTEILPAGEFFFSVAIDGTYAAVGTLTAGSGFAGEVRVFKRIADNDWQLVDTLTASDGAAADSFGWSVAIEGDYMVIGAPQPTIVGGSGSGKAYIFKRDTGLDTWSELEIIIPADVKALKHAGWSVDMHGDWAVIGTNDTSDDDNSVYMHSKDEGGVDNWGHVQTLIPSDVVANDLFGVDAALSDTYLAVVNAPEFEGTQADVYIFKNTAGTWSETEIITLPDTIDAFTFDYFKHTSVDIVDDSHFVAGVQWGDGNSITEAGIAYLYEKDAGLETWSLDETLFASDGATGHRFGFDVGITGDASDLDVVSTAILAPGAAANDGAAYFFNYATAMAGGGGNTGSPSGSDAVRCTVFPPELNLPAELEVNVIGGQPVVELRWTDAEVSNFTDPEKVRILLDYIKKNPGAELDGTGHDLNNIIAKYFYDRIYGTGDSEFVEIFESKLASVMRNFEEVSAELGQMIQCQEHYSDRVYDALLRLLRASAFNAEVEAMFLKFVEELVEIERNLSSTGYDGAFSDFYEKQFVRNLNISDDVTLQVLRDGQVIHEQSDLATTTFTDETLPVNSSGRTRQIEYSIKTSTACGAETGSVGTAQIDPQLQAGTEIDVTADLRFRVKDGFDQLFFEKLDELVESARTNNKIASGIQVNQTNIQATTAGLPTCEEALVKLDQKHPDSSTIMNYVLACHGNIVINDKLRDEEKNIVPPVLIALRLTNEPNHTVVDGHVQPFIDQLVTEKNRALEASGIAIGDLARIDIPSSLTGLTEAEKELILCGGEPNCSDENQEKIKAFFQGNSHAAQVTVEVWDQDGALQLTLDAEADIFGEIRGLELGQFLAGQEYTIKIRLKNELYVLPKVTTVTLNNAERTTSGGFEAHIDLNYDRHFRYGNFDDSNDVIDRNDIVAWGQLIAQNPEKWADANLDGLYGVDLLDVITFQENWGEIQESQVEEEQITLRELAEIFGIITSSETKIQAPGWINLLGKVCS